MGENRKERGGRPNILVLMIDQWEAHMQLPAEVPLPAMERLASQGVSFDRYYCPVPICTPSRASMWTGLHAAHTGLWDNTNFAWASGLAEGTQTIGHMLREQGYYTAFKGKWHLSQPPHSEDALEPYGFSDYQQWGEMFGKPLEGAQLDGAAVFETINWLQHRAPELDQPWMIACCLVNPHDVMFLQTDPIATPNPNGMAYGIQSKVQRLPWFEKQWDITMPGNFEDDYGGQPWGVCHFKEYVDLNFGRIPDDRTDLWLKHRNYLVNAMRLVDAEIVKVLDALDRMSLWENTVVILTGDHGEMNGAHRMTQKGPISFDEAALTNLIACVPGGPQGRYTTAVGSHLDMVPTLLEFAGMSEQQIQDRYPQLKGRSLMSAISNPHEAGPRGSSNAPGSGALFCWDGLHALDNRWAMSGALKDLTDLGDGFPDGVEYRQKIMQEAGKKYGAPDFGNRAFFRAVVDGQYKLTRWFSPEDYRMPANLEDLYAHSDVALYDLVNDPGELSNLARREDPGYDPALVEGMLAKLNDLIRGEIGEDRAPFDLGLFGTREVKS